MKVIIPAKVSSTRLTNKNWRPFHDGKSLVEIQIKKLRKAGFKYSDIYVTSESRQELFALRHRYDINILPRSEAMCDNATGPTTWIEHVLRKVPSWNEIAIAHCTAPTFNEYQEVLLHWKAHKKDHDSLAVAVPVTPHLLIENRGTLQPFGWASADLHVISQDLDCNYAMPFIFSIVTKQSVKHSYYYFGRKPLWYRSRESHPDINTPEEFRDAAAIYAARQIDRTKPLK